MRTFLMTLIALALVVPFRALKERDNSTVWSHQGIVKCSSDKVTATTELEVEDNEHAFHSVPFFEHHGQHDSRLPLFQQTSIPVAVVEPQGCRPPPTA
jgi:hypothetical protein